MHLGKTVEQTYAYNLNEDNIAHELRKIEEEKDIGVIIDSKVEFDTHNEKNKQSKQYHGSKRPFITLNQNNFVSLYKALGVI